MKILIFNWRCWFNPAMGGAEVFTREVANLWVAWGHEVTLFTSEFPSCRQEESVKGVRIVRRGGRFSVYGKAKEYYRKRFRAEKFDIVVDEINTRPFFTMRFVDNEERIVALIHQLAREYWFFETPFPINYVGYYYLENKWLKGYAGVPTVTVSESTKMDLQGLGFSKVFVVPEGLNFKPLDAVPETEQSPIIVYAGRLKRAKRPDHAIKAFGIVREKVPESELWIIGDGPFRRDLEKSACNGVKFFGNVSSEERRQRIKQSWCLVNPSIREGWGLNVVEANALGVPCVAYDVAGLRDSVRDCETGFLAANGNIEDLAEKMTIVLKDDVLRGKLRRNALEYSRGFSWEETAREFMKILERTMDER